LGGRPNQDAGNVLEIRSIAKFLGAYGAGVVTAGFFLSGPIERPTLLQHAPDFRQPSTTGYSGPAAQPPASPSTSPAPPLASPAPAEPPAERHRQPAPAIAIDRPEPPAVETTGSAADASSRETARAPDRDEEPAAASSRAEQSCNYSICRRYYRSFDEATCTYQPYDGPRQLCTR
jgi:hypothetical protein